MNTTPQERKHYYFTWGTLKQGFPNHVKYASALGEIVGHYSSAETLSLIVPKDRFCPNSGCQFVHRFGALTDAIEGHSAEICGELYRVSDEGLAELDSLENYDPNNIESSSYIRREISLKENATGKKVKAYIYFVADASPYTKLLLADRAEVVSEYTLEMAKGDYKPCCQADNKHSGKHDILPFPALASEE